MLLNNQTGGGREWLDRHADEWVDAGLISQVQAEAIRRFEHLDEPEAPQRFTLLTEAGAYIGCVLALMGGAAVVGPNWNDLALAGQLGVAAAVTLVGFLAGTWLVRLDESGARRLGSFLWVVGTGGIGMSAAAVMGEIDPGDRAWFAFVIGLSVLVTGVLLWRNLDRPLQLLSAAVGAGVFSSGLAELADVPTWVIGTSLLALGIGFSSVAALHRVAPRFIALAIGSFTAYIGALTLMDVNEHLGAALALSVAMSVVVFALHDRLIPLLVLGVIGSLVATETLLLTTFTGPIASLIVALLGVAIVAAAIIRTQRTSPPR